MMHFYHDFCVPRLLDWGCGMADLARQRSLLVPLAEGRILEVGFGSGRNLPYYNPERISRIFGIEPLEGMYGIARDRIEQSGLTVEWIGCRAEEIPLQSASVDTVLLTYTLCSIRDWYRALNQMHRVLKPGGKLLFCEHGLAPEDRIARWQHRLTPIWRRITAGCHFDRPIPHLIEQAGFKIQKLESGYLANTPKIGGYHHRGIAHPDAARSA